MRLFIIRHAQSENNLLWDLHQSNQGRNEDPAITDLGRKQARRLAKYLQMSRQEFHKDWRVREKMGYEITHLYSSLMLRALQTASAVAQVLELPILGRTDLFECGGIYLDNEETGERLGQAGPTLRELSDKFPDLVAPEREADRGWWNRPYELPEERVPRARRVIQSLTKVHGHTSDHVALVTHGAFYNALLTVLFKLPEEHNTWFGLNNTAISSIDIWEDAVGINYLNRTEFLPPDMIT